MGVKIGQISTQPVLKGGLRPFTIKNMRCYCSVAKNQTP
jgi:hypothetical protein